MCMKNFFFRSYSIHFAALIDRDIHNFNDSYSLSLFSPSSLSILSFAVTQNKIKKLDLYAHITFSLLSIAD